MNSKYTWLLDSGHGSIINGVYVTPGKRSPVWHNNDPEQLFEGVYNRQVREELVRMLAETGISYLLVTHGEDDVSLGSRVKKVNEIQARLENCVLISIHGNAGKGTGFEVFTSPGETASDPIATIFCEEIMKEFPHIKFRPDYSDKDPDKEAHFYVLTKTTCPALLTENLFMDRIEDCRFMQTHEGRHRIARAHFNAIKRVEGLLV